VEVIAAIRQLGGGASRKEILRLVGRRDLERAVRAGRVVRSARGRYALPTEVAAQRAAHELTGVCILLSAAAHWGWRRVWEPRKPQVAVPRGRRVPAAARAGADIRWRTVPHEDVVGGWVTAPVRTVIDCATLLPFAEALAVVDSALRSKAVTRAELLARVPSLDRQLRARVRRVLLCADPSAANPFESALRAIALEVAGLEVRCQVRIDDADGFIGRVDLADEGLRIVIEADSLEFHGEREALDRDAQRYDRLVADDWLVLRFTWYQVMTRADWVRSVIARTVAVRTERRCVTCR
jgi:very-short-patch-repair endonuclease